MLSDLNGLEEEFDTVSSRMNHKEIEISNTGQSKEFGLGLEVGQVSLSYGLNNITLIQNQSLRRWCEAIKSDLSPCSSVCLLRWMFTEELRTLFIENKVSK